MKTILLADDSITIQKVVELTFSDADYQVISVSNGAQALKKISEVRPNIALLDVIMPEMNGYEVCEQIKRNPSTRWIPVLLLTGTFEPFDRKRAEQAGYDGHLTKPFESQTLVSKVEELIARTPRVAEDAAGSMDIISGGVVYRVEQGVDQMRAAPDAAGRGGPVGGATPSEPAIPMPPLPGETAEDVPEATAGHPALAPPDPAAGGAYIGFADVTGEEEPSIIPDRFDEPSGPSQATARLRRDDLPSPGGRQAPTGVVDQTPPSPGAGADSFSGSFETEFALGADDLIVSDTSGDTSPETGWTPPEEAPPAETWQVTEPESERTAPSARPAPTAAPRDKAVHAPPPATFSPAPAGPAPATLTPEAIDLIAEKVVQRLSDRVVREIAWEVIPSVAEAIVRRRIKELEDEDPA